MTLPEYQYNRIDLATDAIRLIRLLKGSHASSIRCELFESYLDRSNGVPYEALSYAWGNPPATTTSLEIVNEDSTLSGYLEIYPNLYEILRHLRYDNEDRILWIDAICIDQCETHTALQERNHQVGQMRLVYENSDRVLAWLGIFDLDMANLLRVANELDKKMSRSSIRRAGMTISKWQDQLQELVSSHGFHSLSNFSTEGRMSSAISRILKVSWFRRTWIIQEVASAKTGLILGAEEDHEYSVSVPMRMFALLPSILNFECSQHVQAILDVMPRAGQRREGWWNENHDLVTLLRKFTDSECRDPRDSVYALLGICSDARVKAILRPDYELPLDTVLRNTLSYILFGEIVDPRTYELPALAMWNETPFHPDLRITALYWALRNMSPNIALRLLDLEDKPWDHDFGLSFPELTSIVFLSDEISSAEHIGQGFGSWILLERMIEKARPVHEVRGLVQRYLGMNTEVSVLHKLLLSAISRRRLGVAQELLDLQSVNVKGHSPDWDNLLFQALRNQDAAMARMLLQRPDSHIEFKADVVQPSPLHLAAKYGMSDAVNLLLQHRSFDPTVSHRYGTEQALAFAAVNGHARIFESIWNRQDISVDTRWEASDQTLLGIAAAQANGLVMVELILTGTHGVVDVNRLSRAEIPERIGHGTMMTPLKIAALEGHEDIVRYLIDTQKERLNLDAGYEDVYGTPLWAATHRNHAVVVDVLLQHGANPEHKGYALADFKLKQRIKSRSEEDLGRWRKSFREIHPSQGRHVLELIKRTTPLEEAESLGFHLIVEILLYYRS